MIAMLPFSAKRRRNSSTLSVLVVVILLLLQQPASPFSGTSTFTINTTPSRRRLPHGTPSQPVPQQHQEQQQQHCLASVNRIDDTENSEIIINTRRNVFHRIASTLTTAAVMTMTTGIQPASATYSAYTRREQDWQERQKNSNVQYKSAKDLRMELRQIAPMNSEKSRIFCPNGPSSNVSPLMENKCSDQLMALPSVYGRSNDIVGNSIPGFTDGRSTERYAVTSSSSTAEALGGFPSYYKSTKQNW